MVNLLEIQQPKGNIERKGKLINSFLSYISPTKVLNDLGCAGVQAVEIYPLLPECQSVNSALGNIVMYVPFFEIVPNNLAPCRSASNIDRSNPTCMLNCWTSSQKLERCCFSLNLSLNEQPTKVEGCWRCYRSLRNISKWINPLYNGRLSNVHQRHPFCEVIISSKTSDRPVKADPCVAINASQPVHQLPEF